MWACSETRREWGAWRGRLDNIPRCLRVMMVVTAHGVWCVWVGVECVKSRPSVYPWRTLTIPLSAEHPMLSTLLAHPIIFPLRTYNQPLPHQQQQQQPTASSSSHPHRTMFFRISQMGLLYTREAMELCYLLKMLQGISTTPSAAAAPATPLPLTVKQQHITAIDRIVAAISMSTSFCGRGLWCGAIANLVQIFAHLAL